MPLGQPFDLPDDVVDAATALLVEASTAERTGVLAKLTERFPEYEAGLRALSQALAGADRVLGSVFALPGDEPEFDGYRVVRRLGEGAFGVVYLCEQSAPIRRQVAIKLLRPGAGDRSTLRRFEAERHYLARLQHPAIAQIHTAGAIADGRPWFVMEFVDGMPITTWCDRTRLSIEGRLRLFVRVCQGVQHAHEQGVVHRDLKPSNILVRQIDGEPQPTIIDFGIARALQPTNDGEEDQLRTETGRIVGTPGYMSPEQAQSRLGEVDARSDVWSLGVLLFEMLTGSLPFATAPATDADPVRPSRRLTTTSQGLDAIAEHRGTDARRLLAAVRGDLDWIVAKALTWEREGRYASVLDLAEDVSRHVRGDPVHAGPPSWHRRLRRLARKRRTLFAFLAAITVLTVGTSWLLAGYRERAETSGEQAEAAVAALLARANDPALVQAPNTAAARKALAADALAFYDRFLGERPDDATLLAGRARTLTTLSQVHWLLGDAEVSERLVREAVAAFDSLLAAANADPGLLRAAGLAHRYLGRAVSDSQGNLAAAEPHFQRAVELLELAYAQQPGESAALLVDGLRLLSQTVAADLAQAAIDRAERLQEAVCAANPQDLAAGNLLGQVLVARCGLSLARGDPVAARHDLERATALDARQPLAHEVRYQMLHCAAVLSPADEGPAALAARQRVADAAKAWLAAEPARMAAHAMAWLARLELAETQQAQGLACQTTAQETADLAAAWIERFPNNPQGRVAYCIAVDILCRDALTRGGRAELIGLEAMARRACQHAAGLPDSLRGVHAWRSQGVMGLVADALGLADGDALWAEYAAMSTDLFGDAPLPTDAGVAGDAVMFGNRIARRLLASGDTAQAEVWLARLEAWEGTSAATDPMLSVLAPDTSLQRAVAALQRHDLTAAERAADAALARDGDWRGTMAAAEAMSLVWLAARDAGQPHAARRDRALGLCDAALALLQPQVAATPDDPWLTLPELALQLRRALAAADRGDALDPVALQATLEAYVAAEPNVHAYAWDPTLAAAARRLLDR